VKILDRLPYSADATLVAAPGASVRVKPFQIHLRRTKNPSLEVE
jgi:hypothetical protein